MKKASLLIASVVVGATLPVVVFAHNGIDHSQQSTSTPVQDVAHEESLLYEPSAAPELNPMDTHQSVKHDITYGSLFGGAFIIGSVIQIKQKRKQTK